MGPYRILPTQVEHIAGVAALQRACFAEPFPAELLWQSDHIQSHIDLFPLGQWVAVQNGAVVASCTNMLIARAAWLAHRPFTETLGGLHLANHNPEGEILLGVDISVHPDHRKRGLARLLYAERFDYVRYHNLQAYGTVCRLPGFQKSGEPTPESYAQLVLAGKHNDPTLTPFLKMGLAYQGIIQSYMEDEESGNAGAILEWTP